MKKSSIICITIGFTLVLIGLSALLSLPIIVLKIIHNKLVLSADSMSYKLWRDLPVPIYQKFYLFNVTNAEEVVSSGARPDLTQVGPFVYRLDMKKHDLNFTQGGQRVSFTEHFTYHFERQLSVNDLSLKITTLNTPLALAIGFLEDLSFAKKTLSIVLINALKEEFFIERTVGELLFDGYPDVLTQLANKLNPKIPYQRSFGWMYARNDTNDGVFVANTGKTDINLLNSIESFNGLPELTYWSGSQCNAFNGAKNGELFNPISDTDKSLLFFRTDFCRVWSLVWESSLKSRFGDLFVYRYSPALNIYANSSQYPPNSCYKPNPNNSIELSTINEEFDLKKQINSINNSVNFEPEVIKSISDTFLNYMKDNKTIEEFAKHVSKYRDFPSGVFDLSSCHFGASIFLSNPHFFNADPSYLTTVSGLSPNSSEHKSYLDVEPITGTPIELVLRLQLNVYIKPAVSLFLQYRRVPQIHVPVIWQEFTIHATQQMAHDLHWSLTGPSMIGTIVSALFVAIGSLTLVFVVTKPWLRRCTRKHTGANNTVDINSDNSHLIDATDADDTQPLNE